MSTTAGGADLLHRPVHELAALIRRGELSSRDLVQASLDRIDELNPSINAFVDVFADEALAEADGIGADDERPFAGVPIAIKNNRGIAGKRLTFGSDMTGDFRAPEDHNVVRRLKAAGFVIVGSTTLPEWGILPTTEARRFGATRNPWDQSRTTGGSSGGSGAAVAAGMVPVAHGNDGGGSIRIPAAACGLVGLKPQRNRVSVAPDGGHSFLVQDGVLTRTVAETAALLDILAGMEPGDMAWVADPDEPFAAAVAGEARPRRIAMTTLSPVPDAQVGAEQAQAVQDAATLLESLGHHVEEVDPPWARPELELVFTACFGPAVMAQAAFIGRVLGREPQAEDMEPLSWALYEVSRNINAIDGFLAELQLHQVGRELITWMSGYDALLTPVFTEAPVTLGTIDPLNEAEPLAGMLRASRFMPFTPPANLSGQPAIALPLYEDAAGLPLAVQLIGQPADEATLLALGAQIEAAHPWAERRPTL